MFTSLIRIYHSTACTREKFKWFLEWLAKLLEHEHFIFGLSYRRGEFAYSLSGNETVMKTFESKLYTEFGDFQIIADTMDLGKWTPGKSVVASLDLTNGWYFPFALHGDGEETDFMNKFFRSFDTLNPGADKVSFFLSLEPFEPKWLPFFLSTWWRVTMFRLKLILTFYKYIFDKRAEKWWKSKGFHFYHEKLSEELFHAKLMIVVESDTEKWAHRIAEWLLHNFSLFKNPPLNEFRHHISPLRAAKDIESLMKQGRSELILTPDEVSRLYRFPTDPAKETALLKINARKLALPIGMPILPYTMSGMDIVVGSHDPSLAIFAESDYRSVRVPIGIYDEDRLRHMYVIGKTGVGKSKFLVGEMIDDITYGKWLAVVDPHGDLIEEVMMHIPESRKKDVIIFDPTDEEYPFCFNPLTVEPGESKQVLAKGFIDIFKKFFGANWNPKLEHVLRMLFLGLLDVPKSTVFDMIRALTDKDFRYVMIEHVKDDVVRNFWTNEFAGWSQQFNSDAIMPILNKVGQLLSIDMVKNIFVSSENKLNLREVMDNRKILLVKLPKGRLQEEIMGFLGAMIVTKIYQTAMGRTGTDKNSRVPFFLYIDEFQNFATDTFAEILSEARKYGLGLTVAHQFLRQIPENLIHAIFGNIGTLVSFRVSTEDARIMATHFDPYVWGYDLANLWVREAYAKMLVKWQVRDPLSIRTRYVEDIQVDPVYVKSLYDASRSRYARPLQEVQKAVIEKQEVIAKLEGFGAPIL
jgi:Type IV secretion-system coupling protein DNA-binding domain